MEKERDRDWRDRDRDLQRQGDREMPLVLPDVLCIIIRQFSPQPHLPYFFSGLISPHLSCSASGMSSMECPTSIHPPRNAFHFPCNCLILWVSSLIHSAPTGFKALDRALGLPRAKRTLGQHHDFRGLFLNNKKILKIPFYGSVGTKVNILIIYMTTFSST